ncbi:hypothetical protein EJB05_53460 [Eragrostis curvula]|uniref:Glycine-rich protein n=1 Tax=Eragrostis curvula TaxID=38414 RepID=A0A5J9SPY7_9POAL|nr:hypothetical protein EJB05_53460 [Eragrostis curvula]
MAIKSVLLLGIVLGSVLLISQDVVYARELTETNESEGKNVKPAGGPALKDEKWFGGYKNGGGYGNGGKERSLLQSRTHCAVCRRLRSPPPSRLTPAALCAARHQLAPGCADLPQLRRLRSPPAAAAQRAGGAEGREQGRRDLVSRCPSPAAGLPLVPFAV